MSAAFKVSPDDAAGLAEAIRRAAAGEVVHVVRAGQRLADIVPPTRAIQDQTGYPNETATHVVAEPETAAADVVGDLGGVDDCELDEAAMAALEARMASRPATELTASQIHAERFGAPTMSHYRAVYARAGAPWPGEAFVRRHHPVADGS